MTEKEKWRMSTKTLVRASGLALLIGAVLATIGNVLNSLLFPGNDPSQFSNPLLLVLMWLGAIGSILLLIGLPGLAARQGARGGWLGFVGFVFTWLGGLLFTSLNFINIIIIPWLAQEAPKLAASNGPGALFVAYLVASVSFALGGILLGIAIMRGKIWSRWTGILLLAGAVLNLVDFPLNGLISGIVSAVAFILFAGALAWVGYGLIAGGRGEAAIEVASSSSQVSA
jgi:hypothetical protein